MSVIAAPATDVDTSREIDCVLSAPQRTALSDLRAEYPGYSFTATRVRALSGFLELDACSSPSCCMGIGVTSGGRVVHPASMEALDRLD